MPNLLPLRFVVRQFSRLRRSAGYSAIVTLCLGLGLAATALIFAIVDATLVRPLPFGSPDQLLQVWKTFDTDQARGLQYGLPPKDFEFLRDNVASVQVGANQPVDFDVLTGEGRPEQVSGALVTGNHFSLLDIQPSAGRLLDEDDELTEAAVVLIDESFAQRHYGSSVAALGKTLNLGGSPAEVVGVLPTGAVLPNGAEIWAPLTRQAYEGRLGFSVIARLNRNTSARTAVDEIRQLGSRLIEVDPARNGEAGLDAEDLQRNLTGDLRPTLVALLVSALFLLAIACANTSSLVVARAQSREGERALQRMLGAGRLRLLAEALTENGLLTGIAAVFALALATAALPAVMAISPIEAFTYAPIRIDLRVVAAVLAIAITMAVLLSLNTWVGSKNLDKQLRASRRLTRTPRALAALVIFDVLLTTVLLFGAGSMIQTVSRMTSVAPGLDTTDLTTVGVSISPIWSEEHVRRVAFFEQALIQANSIPGVQAAAAVNLIPMTEPEYYWGFNVEGQPQADPSSMEVVLFRVVTPEYFLTLGTSLIEGRDFRIGEGAAQKVAIVNKSFANRYFPGQSAVGRRLKRGTYETPGEWVEIVGVAGDVRERGLSRDVVPAIFLPLPQWNRRYLSRMSLLLRTEPDAPSPITALRERIEVLDQGAVLYDIESMSAIVDRSLGRQRFALFLLFALAMLAAVQAAAGIYGVMAFDVNSRLREIGVRLALGSTPARVCHQIQRTGISRGALGLGAGTLIAGALVRYGGNRFEGVTSTGPEVYAAVLGIMALVIAAATYLPARRASLVDPVANLRKE